MFASFDFFRGFGDDDDDDGVRSSPFLFFKLSYIFPQKEVIIFFFSPNYDKNRRYLFFPIYILLKIFYDYVIICGPKSNMVSFVHCPKLCKI